KLEVLSGKSTAIKYASSLCKCNSWKAVYTSLVFMRPLKNRKRTPIPCSNVIKIPLEHPSSESTKRIDSSLRSSGIISSKSHVQCSASNLDNNHSKNTFFSWLDTEEFKLYFTPLYEKRNTF